MRSKIRLDTLKDINRFAGIAAKINDDIIVTNAHGNYRVNAKSILGLMYAIEWNDIYLETKTDHYSAFSEFIIDESDH